MLFLYCVVAVLLFFCAPKLTQMLRWFLPLPPPLPLRPHIRHFDDNSPDLIWLVHSKISNHQSEPRHNLTPRLPRTRTVNFGHKKKKRILQKQQKKSFLIKKKNTSSTLSQLNLVFINLVCCFITLLLTTRPPPSIPNERYEKKKKKSLKMFGFYCLWVD